IACSTTPSPASISATWRGSKKRPSPPPACPCRRHKFSDTPDCPGHRLYGIGKQNKGLEQQGEWNAYRPNRMPSGDGLRRASKDLQAVPQARAFHHRRPCHTHGSDGRVRGLTGSELAPKGGKVRRRPI